MERDFGNWYRFVDIEPNSEMLENRWKGVEAFTDDIKYGDVIELSRLFHGIKPKDDMLENRFREVFLNVDKAFRMKDNKTELSVLAGSSLARIFTQVSGDLAQLAAYATVCPDLQGKRKSAAVPAISDNARRYLRRSSQDLRAYTTDISAEAKPLRSRKTGLNTDSLGLTDAQLLDLLNDLCSASNRTQESLSLFREDSDILWWLMGECSRDLERPFEKIVLPEACLVAGKELSDLVIIIPGPFAAQAVLHKMLSNVGQVTQETVVFSEAVNQPDRNWRENWMKSLELNDTIDLCPILFAVRKSLQTEQPDVWYPYFESAFSVGAAECFSPLEIATQVYEESLFVRLATEILGIE